MQFECGFENAQKFSSGSSFWKTWKGFGEQGHHKFQISERIVRVRSTAASVVWGNKGAVCANSYLCFYVWCKHLKKGKRRSIVDESMPHELLCHLSYSAASL